jgi:GMP synthase-like glutamine amidotransferase
MRLHVVKHVPYEGPGGVVDWARARGHRLAVTELAYGQALPRLEDLDALVLMGGPMSVHDTERYPWIKPEQELIQHARSVGKPILGICLGAQMIAAALGASVTALPEKEIGWFPVEVVPGAADHPYLAGWPQAWPLFHWHGESFEIPRGARRLWRSAACENQAFALGRILALQCHPEVDAGSLRDMLENGRAELDASRPFIQSEAVILAQAAERLKPLPSMLGRLLDAWIA